MLKSNISIRNDFYVIIQFIILKATGHLFETSRFHQSTKVIKLLKKKLDIPKTTFH